MNYIPITTQNTEYVNQMLKQDNYSSDDDNEDNNQKKIVYQNLQQQFESLPQSNDIIKNDKQISLQADMIFGWKPQINVNGPIPLKFQNKLLEYIIDAIYKKRIKNVKLIYLGFRPQNSFELHQEYSNKTDTYRFDQLIHFKELTKNVSQYIQFGQNHETSIWSLFQGMNQQYLNDESIIFDSKFESGNLDCVLEIQPYEYDLYMRIDSNTRGHNQWFYFSIENAPKNTQMTFNICNFTKKQSLYRNGMKPYVFSQKQFEIDKIQWVQDGYDIRYERKNFVYNILFDEYQGNRHYQTLSFSYRVQHDNDKIFFAYCVPYTFSDLQQFLKNINCEKSVLCKTLSGLDVPLLTVTNQDHNNTKLPKKVVLVTARIHPGESNGSWVMQGFLKFLCGSSREAQYLRNNVIFKIVPMLNPDGVIMGNYRTGFGGRDLNRQFKYCDKKMFPTVAGLINLANNLRTKYQDHFAYYFDLHGHSIKNNVFIYGPKYQIYDENYYLCRLIPKMLSLNTNMFRFQSCLFQCTKDKLTTARAYLQINCKIVNSFTVESSFGIYNYKDTSGFHIIFFDADKFEQMGKSICSTFFQYIEKVRLFEIQLLKRQEQRMIEKIEEDKKEKALIKEQQEYMSKKNESQKDNKDEKSKDKKMIKNKNKKKKSMSVQLNKKDIKEKSADDYKNDQDFLKAFDGLVNKIMQDEQQMLEEKNLDIEYSDHSDSESSEDDFNVLEHKKLIQNIDKCNKNFNECINNNQGKNSSPTKKNILKIIIHREKNEQENIEAQSALVDKSKTDVNKTNKNKSQQSKRLVEKNDENSNQVISKSTKNSKDDKSFAVIFIQTFYVKYMGIIIIIRI